MLELYCNWIRLKYIKSAGGVIMKKILAVILLVSVSLFNFSACTSIKSSGRNTNGKFTDEYNVEKIENGFITANNGFAFDILEMLNREDVEKNMFISPFSISTALSMTYNGAVSETKDVMAEVLGYSNIELERLNKNYKNLIAYLNNVDKQVELNIGNSIWVREGEEIREDFINRNNKYFNAEIDMLDFSKKEAADKINGWIKDATKGKIKKMINPPISELVVMYLINAIYFKGEWTEQFDPKRTYDGSFSSGSGQNQDVRMMNRKGNIDYAEMDDCKAIRLSYGSGKTSMYCVLPGENTDINEFIANMDENKWNEIRESLSETEDVTVKLPKFKMEYGIKNLNESLQSLGMEAAFSQDANFSGIREGLFISRVLHKAVIEVNEEGSEAAGVTVVEMKECAMVEDPKMFVGDRPFIFFIAEEETGSILFAGKLYDIDTCQ